MATSTDESTNQSSASLDQSLDGILMNDQSQDGLQMSDQSQTGLFTDKGDNSTDDEDNEMYYFESDHVALKGNHDYHLMLRAIALLEAQRIQAVKDLDLLYEGREQALADPIQFVQKLQRGVHLDLPKPQKIADLPEILWDKYTSRLDFTSFGTHRHMTRLKRQLLDGNKAVPILEDVKTEPVDSDSVVRGRVKTDSKPQTFNQLWTTDEQKRLEELLVMYPPEEVEARRFQKIAAALTNRTVLQVQSRVQKYFIKLARAGLPIPGRMPNLVNHRKRGLGGPKPRHQRPQMFNTSTFLASVTPPVFMRDEDEDEYSQSYEGSMNGDGMNHENYNGDLKEEPVSDDESIPLELRDTSEYHELLRLKQLRKRQFGNAGDANQEHIGFKCDRCDCEPIFGTRWHCTDCPPDLAVDFCDNCVESGYETATHNSSHRLKPKHVVSNFMDTDYTSFTPGGPCTQSGYNYLDPNYMPVT